MQVIGTGGRIAALGIALATVMGCAQSFDEETGQADGTWPQEVEATVRDLDEIDRLRPAIGAPLDDGQARVTASTALGVTQLPYYVVDGIAMVGDDIELGPVEELERGTERGLVRNTVAFPSGVIEWYPDNLEPDWIDRFREATRHLEARSPIDFIEHPYRRHDNMLKVEGTYNNSYRGRVTNGGKTLKLSQNDTLGAQEAILHELGHVLGFPHEHQRPDRDEHVSVDNCTRNRSQYSKYKADDITYLSPFDVNSIMMYRDDNCTFPIGGGIVEPLAWYGISQVMSPDDYNSIYRAYADGLSSVAEDQQLGVATATADFDLDGIDDIVTVSNAHYTGAWRHVHLNFYRGVHTDSSEHGAPDHKYVPWFRHFFGTVTDSNFAPALAVGDFDGDTYPDLAMGYPGAFAYDGNFGGFVHGMVSVFFINSSTRFDPWPFERATWGAKWIEQRVDYNSAELGLSVDFDHGFGHALTTGRFTSTDRDDLLIGAPTAVEGAYMPGSQVAVIGRQGGAVVHVQNPRPGSPGFHSVVRWNPESYPPIVGPDTVGGPTTGPRKTKEFGAALTTLTNHCSAPDDTARDAYVVGDPGYDHDRGAIFVYRCAVDDQGLAIRAPRDKTITHSTPGDRYGEVLTSFHTGPDSSPLDHYVVVGSPEDNHFGYHHLGAIYLVRVDAFSGPYFKAFTVHPPPNLRRSDARFGEALAVHRMTEPNDPHSDRYRVRIAIGAPGAANPSNTSRITGHMAIWTPWVLNGPNGGTITTIAPSTSQENARFGRSLAAIEDRQRDGGFVVGAPRTLLPALTYSNGLPVVDVAPSGQVGVYLETSNLTGNWNGTLQNLNLATRGDKRVP